MRSTNAGRWATALLQHRKWELAFAAVVIVPYLAFFAFSAGRVGPQDLDQFLVFHELQYWNSTLFGTAKQWTPVLCGGLSLAGEPQVPFASLSMVFGYLLGPLRGIETALVIYVSLGWLGAYLYAGAALLNRRERALAATLFIGNPFLMWRLAVGQIDFVPFFLLPLFLWCIHRSGAWLRTGSSLERVTRTGTAVLLIGALISVAIDGSPVAIVHLLFWVALYAVVFAFATRDASPIVIGTSSLLVTSFLDAGYLWPMLHAQQQFPRLTPDRHTTPLALLFHALIPLRGKILPVNGKGHELTVYVGPFLAWVLFRYRDTLRELPRSFGLPLLVVSAISVVLGIGSLRPLHIPAWLSPFDLLRPLPGFRSLEVTGRYWGFLSIPLCLFAAKAICRYLDEKPPHSRLPQVMTLMILLQLAIEGEAFVSPWYASRNYKPVSTATLFRNRTETVTQVLKGERLQGEIITPTRGVLDCYDHDDFIRARIDAGAPLAQAQGAELPKGVAAGFSTWNDIFVRWSPSTLAVERDGAGRGRLTINQAWHSGWHSDVCVTERDARNRLVLDCTVGEMESRAARLHFEDHFSSLGSYVSRIAWCVWLVLGASSVGLLRLVYVRSEHIRNADSLSDD